MDCLLPTRRFHPAQKHNKNQLQAFYAKYQWRTLCKITQKKPYRFQSVLFRLMMCVCLNMSFSVIRLINILTSFRLCRVTFSYLNSINSFFHFLSSSRRAGFSSNFPNLMVTMSLCTFYAYVAWIYSSILIVIFFVLLSMLLCLCHRQSEWSMVLLCRR